MKIVALEYDRVQELVKLLESVTITGFENARLMAKAGDILRTGKLGELNEEKEEKEN